ncbi:MAG: hypothetical protein IJ679_09655 [Lachnospiraceae bacterium]|nr:hypothetical protein [Lachnospiraceae bacterium]
MKEFQTALQSFSFEAAAGRAIRHLCDLGLSAEEIEKRLDFPVPLNRIEREMHAYLEEKAAAECGETERYTYVREYGKYGKTYMRRVPVKNEQ